jgi:tight adherence protein C
LIFGLVAVGAALFLTVYLLSRPATVPAAVPADMAELLAVAVVSRPAQPSGPSAISRRMSGLGARLAPSDYLQRAQRRLDLAGNPGEWTPDRLLAAKGLGIVVGVLIGLLIGFKHGGLITLLLIVSLGAFGLFLPDIYIRNVGEHRQQKLQQGLADALDMMTVCVEAGLGFDAALGRVSRNIGGPMGEESARVLQEMQVGMSRTQALRALVERTSVMELRSFVTAVTQSTELGISMGDVLREQAKQQRIKRHQRAEEKAQKMQIKMLFPLIVCLLPAMFIVVLGPAAIQIAHFFGKTAQ